MQINTSVSCVEVEVQFGNRCLHAPSHNVCYALESHLVGLVRRELLLTLSKISVATFDNQIVDLEIAVKFEMRDAPKVHDVQT